MEVLDELCEMSCGSEVGRAGGGGATEEEEKNEAEEEAEEEPGVSEQKQKPHTKMWGKKKHRISPVPLSLSDLGTCTATCPSNKGALGGRLPSAVMLSIFSSLGLGAVRSGAFVLSYNVAPPNNS